MPDALLDRVAAFLRPRDLLRPEALLLVAVSGGPDSLCLLHLLDRLRQQGGPALHVAHLDHGARGPQSRAEAAAVAAMAAAWGLPATVARRDVPALARQRREGLLAAARRARYAFLAEAARAAGARAVATAHQADDQAETVLLHLLRGAGLAGLRGMRPVVPWEEWGARGDEGTRRPGDQETAAPALIRPLLGASRAEIAAYCAEQGLAPFDDPSNSAPRYARARVRRLLPILAAENPHLVEALGRTARVCADDYDYMQRQLDAAWPALAEARAGAVTLRRGEWAGLHTGLQRYALRRAAGLLGQAELSLEQVEAARELAAHSGRTMPLGPRLLLSVDQGSLTLAVISGGEERNLSGGEERNLVTNVLFPQRAVDELPLAGPAHSGGEERNLVTNVLFPQLAVDELPLGEAGVTPLGGEWACSVGPEAPAEPGPWWVALDAERLDGPLLLRRRRAGDRFRPAGGRGSRKLQDFFVDRRVPWGRRDRWPILATPAAVVWVAGLRADGRFVAGETTRSTIWVGIVRRGA